MNNAFRIDADQVTRELGVSPERGLDSGEVERRRQRFGANELVGKPPEPLWKKVLKQFNDPLIYLLLGAIVISLVAWSIEGAHGFPIDALVIAVIVVANAVIGLVEENKAENAVGALATMTAAHSTVIREGKKVEVPSDEIVPGGILSLAEGDAVGADARLISATALRIQEASLTGESESAEKDVATITEEVGIGDRANMVFRGTAVTSGVGLAVVTDTGMSTEMGKIATLLDETEAAPSPLQVEINKISKTLGILVIAIAVIVMVALWVINGVSSLHDAVEILLLGVSLAVAAVPEGLPAILSLVLAIGVQALARRNAIMKELHSVETLGSTSVICSDKTGTLTKNEMTIRAIRTASGYVELSGTGYEPVGQAKLVRGKDDAQAEARLTIRGGALANNAQLAQNSEGTWEIVGDPTEAAFLVAEPKILANSASQPEPRRLGEVPFNSERKMMSVLVEDPQSQSVRIYTKGAPDVLLQHCEAEQVGAQTRPLTENRREDIRFEVAELSAQGYRTLGVAWREAAENAGGSGGVVEKEFGETSERDLVYTGTVAIIDPPRPEAREAIELAHRAGIRTVMITGDHPITAKAIADDLGMSDDAETTVVTGQDISAMDGAQLARTVQETEVYARVAPEHKLQIVDALQNSGKIVAMTGDGVNDAPALKSADIGIAMGITGTEVTKEAGKMVLADDNYATIVAAVRQGRNIFDNIKKFMRYLLSSNMGEVFTVFLGVVCGGIIGLADPADPAATVVPLLATQILWINLVTDSGPALAMGVDPEVGDVMRRRPRNINDSVIDRQMWTRIIGIGAVMGMVSLVIYDLCLPGGLIGGFEHLGAGAASQLDVARTTVFTALVMMQLFNALNSRSDTESAFVSMFANKWLWGSIVLAAILQVAVVEWAPLQAAFGTASLDAAHWVLAIGAGVVVLLVEEIIKLARRAKLARR